MYLLARCHLGVDRERTVRVVVRFGSLFSCGFFGEALLYWYWYCLPLSLIWRCRDMTAFPTSAETLAYSPFTGNRRLAQHNSNPNPTPTFNLHSNNYSLFDRPVLDHTSTINILLTSNSQCNAPPIMASENQDILARISQLAGQLATPLLPSTLS